MWRDPIVEEIREARHRIEAECGHDWDRLVAYYREVQRKAEQDGSHPVFSGSPKQATEPQDES